MANTHKKVETVADFIFLDFKITVDGDCSHKIKTCLLLGRKAMTNLDSILKSREITQHQSLFQWVGSSHQVANVKVTLQLQSFQ